MERIIYSPKVYALHYAAGIHYGYPTCCVTQFCEEVIRGIRPAVRRCNTFHIKFGVYNIGSRPGYVPCDSCMTKWLKRYNIRTYTKRVGRTK